MSAVVAQRPRLFRDAHQPLGRSDAPRRGPTSTGGDRPTTLEQRLERVWEGLGAGRAACCLVCGSDGPWRRLTAPAGDRDPHPAAAVPFRCEHCGSTMS